MGYPGLTAEEFDKIMWGLVKPQPIKRFAIVNYAMMLYFHYLEVLKFVELTPELLGTVTIWDEFYDMSGNMRQKQPPTQTTLYGN